MKFFKQTKETKRKISFFMALAMVISLLPASPVVKAGSTNTASNDSKIYVNVETEAGKYVEYVETVTGGATKENEATTASVIATTSRFLNLNPSDFCASSKELTTISSKLSPSLIIGVRIPRTTVPTFLKN